MNILGNIFVIVVGGWIALCVAIGIFMFGGMILVAVRDALKKWIRSIK